MSGLRLWSLAMLGAGLAVVTGAPPALAQEAPSRATPQVQSEQPQAQQIQAEQIFPILAFDRARIIAQSQMGVALEAQIESERAALLAENDQIYADLEAEEQEISDQRKMMSEEAFRARAAEFDAKVTEVRAQQDEKAQAVQRLYDSALEEMETEMNTVLTRVARDLGAVVVFERQQVYLMSGSIDVTKVVIDRLDAIQAQRDAATATAPKEPPAEDAETQDTQPKTAD
ncbi:OmpH family outer membrane protein [Celeribacter baekdonensis]|jgi:Skp family chaperone for outer membrane proteins|uniref:Outer membrane chaperone Skp (OmpH) n=1 Tax=Celeribacter baekdonensis B30 TaxID=1208323 RepID=K2JB65_9RHOB|nr:OmpH family outer membrane protein [Celeribacter baekdonensis]EKE72037.1 outer membrane chaperone Skp (OmpH) [Celeribacter baekdonensis B30]